MTIWIYNTHMGYTNLEEGVMNCYLLLCQTWKWTKKPFFHFSGTTFPKSSSFWLHESPKWLIETLDFISLIEKARVYLTHVDTWAGQVTRIEVNFTSHQPFPSFRLYHWACSACGIDKSSSQVHKVRCGTVFWWMLSRLPQNNEVLNINRWWQVLRITISMDVAKKYLLSYSMLSSKHTETSICHAWPFAHTL
jgi:hypothetical protein